MKKINHQVIDNVLPKNTFKNIQEYFLKGEKIGWTLSNYVSDKQSNDGWYLVHQIFNHPLSSPLLSPSYNIIVPVLKCIEPKALMRIKVNLYPKTEEIIHHGNHSDLPFPHKGCILYLNTNDGLTVINDEIFVESVENRILLFDSSIPHHSTTCTDKNYRANINFNYF